MMQDDRTTPADHEPPALPKPEEAGRPVPGKGQAIEPEATHVVTDGAVVAGDRMWGPPGTPRPTD